MNIRDLQYLVAVYDFKNFSKAAESCFVSQPTLSGQLKKLEQQLGAPLMERSTRQVLFTELGEEVVTKAREVLLTVEQIKELARQSDDPLVGDFHIGLIPTVGPFLLSLLMPVLNDKYPKMNVYLYELQTDQLIDQLLKGQLDAGILAKLDWQYPVRETALYTEEMKLAVPLNDPLAKYSGAVKRKVLDGRSVLMLEDGHCLRDQALGVCFSAGAKEDARYQATSMDTLLHMVAAGKGLTLIPQLACHTRDGIKYLSFDDPKPTREIVMLMRKNSTKRIALDLVAELVTELVG